MRVFALLLVLLCLVPGQLHAQAAAQPEPGYDPSLYQGQVQPPPPPPEEQGYVPRRYRQQEQPTPVRLPVSAALPASFFVGRWGQVSFNNADDLPKMAKVAREYCNLPVTIALSSPNTFKMYVATELKEVQVFEQSGSLYVIPTAQVSDGAIRGARELHVIDNNTFTLRYLEDEAHRHYGPNVFVRCGAAAITTQQQKPSDKAPADVKKPVKKKKRAAAKEPAELKVEMEKLSQPTEEKAQ